MDEHADGAHLGMTVQMEHTPCKDPLTDEVAVVSEFGLHLSCDFILLFSLVSVYIFVWLSFYANMYPTCNCNIYACTYK